MLRQSLRVKCAQLGLMKQLAKELTAFFVAKKQSSSQKEVKSVDLGKEEKKEWLSWLAVYG